MQKRLQNYLQQPSPLFLQDRRGRIYFVLLIPTLALLLNVLQPFWLVNWHAQHKSLFLSGYSVLLSGTYTLIYLVYSHLHPAYFDPATWTIGKELRILSIYIPLTAIDSWIYALLYMEKLELSLYSFLNLQWCNAVLNLCIVLFFGLLVSTKLRPVEQTQERLQQEEQLPEVQLPEQLKQEEQLPEVQPPVSVEKADIITVKKDNVYVSKILFAECGHNKVLIISRYGDHEQRLTKYISMTAFEDLVVGYSYIKRCHMSYMVNVNQIESWNGTSEKMTLRLKDSSYTVPVSETYIPCFKVLMEQLQLPKL